MFVGNTCYVFRRYNEVTFRLLLESHFKKGIGSELGSELIEQSIAALLECKDSNKVTEHICKMETLMEKLGIVYTDVRSYDRSPVIGNPEDAIKAFNKISADFLKMQKFDEYEK